MAEKFADVKGLLFDVFGTCVDWRASVTNYLKQQAQKTLYLADDCMPRNALTKMNSMTDEDWGKFAHQWRGKYLVWTKKIASNPEPTYKPIDQHFYESLNELLEEWEIWGIWDDKQVREMSLIWHKLDPWPDTVEGLHLLNKRFSTSTLSNGNVSLLKDMADYGQLPWTNVFSAEMFESYKPDPKVYLGAAEKLGLKPEQCALVAAHLNDLRAAKDCGFKALYVERSQEEEYTGDQIEETKKIGWVDLWVKIDEKGFVAAANKLGIS